MRRSSYMPVEGRSAREFILMFFKFNEIAEFFPILGTASFSCSTVYPVVSKASFL
jgi:hypothetical protein